MKNNPANDIKDTMWHFLMDKGQKANPKALKEAVYDLIGMTTQKNAGQRKTKKDIDWDSLDMTLMSIAIEATALILSGELDKQIPHKPKDVSRFDDIFENFSVGICPACGAVVDETENYCRKCGQAIDWSDDTEPEVDWSNVPIDTPILVKDSATDKWARRYFAGVDGAGVVTAWNSGGTSWSRGETFPTRWAYAKLAEVTEKR